MDDDDDFNAVRAVLNLADCDAQPFDVLARSATEPVTTDDLGVLWFALDMVGRESAGDELWDDACTYMAKLADSAECDNNATGI